VDWRSQRPTSNVQSSDCVVRATNTIPLLAARIAIEPVGVVSPLGAIGGRVKVHESLSCERLVHQYRSEARELAALPQPSQARSLPSRVRCADGTFAHAASAAKSQRAPSTAVAAARQGRGAMGRVRGGCEVMVGPTHARMQRDAGRRSVSTSRQANNNPNQQQRQEQELPHLSDSLNQPNQPRCLPISLCGPQWILDLTR